MTIPEETEGEVAKVAEVKSPEKEGMPDTKRQKTVDENGEEQTVEDQAVEQDDDEEQSFDDGSAENDDEETSASVAKEVDGSNIIPRYYYCVGIWWQYGDGFVCENIYICGYCTQSVV